MSQQIDSVYQDVADFYKKIGLYYEPKALDRTKFWFDAHSKDRPVKKVIDGIYRFKSGEEYMYYHERWLGTDHIGNKIEWGWVVGKVDIPYAHYEWVEATNTREATSIEGHDTKYEIPFNDKNIKEIEHEFHNDTKYYVTDGDRTYGGFTKEMFRTWVFEDLVYFGKTGMKPGTQVVTPDTAKAAEKLEDEKKKR